MNEPKMPHQKLYKYLFILAGLHNIAWGIFGVLNPNWFFEFAELEPATHPEIYAALAMFIGGYGFLYWKVAFYPQQEWAIVIVALIGKILGLLGTILFIAQGTWPLQTFLLCAINDGLWLLPFGMYLFDCWQYHSEIRNRNQRSVSILN